MSARWPAYFCVVGAAALVATSSALHLSKLMALALAAAIPAVVVLLRLDRALALQVCIVAAAFFAGAPVKFGEVDVTDIFLFLIVGILILKPSDERVQPAPRGLLIGLSLLILGGVVGMLFKPATPPFSDPGLVVPRRLLFLSPSMSDVVRFTYGTIWVILVVRLCRLTRAQTRRAIIAFVLGATVSTVWGVFQDPGYLGRSAGLTVHPVVFGWISAYSALVGIGLLLSKTRAAKRVGVLALVLGLVGIGQSGTRSGVLMLVAGFLIVQLGLRSMRRVSQFILLGLLAVAIGLSGVAGDTPVATRLKGNSFAEVSDQGRATIQKESFALVREHGVTGIGLRYLYPAHNLILGVLGATGVIGLIGLLVVVVSLLRRLLSLGPDETMAMAVLAAALSVYACAWVVNVGWGQWFWLPVALVLSAPAARAGDQEANRRPVDAAQRTTRPSEWYSRGEGTT
jgi:O-antigen ligase